MKLELTAHGIELTPDLRERVERRIRFSLGRFSQRIERLTIRLADVNGPRGGVDKSCSIRVEAGFSQPVVVREQQDNIHLAVAMAADRTERTMARRLETLHRRTGT